ncbi:hypothetical protein SAY86_005860 [Trapa natans]|uniref:PORR domain-containing protein n=1 Tax=Trapa natans TaxID=22666 RepID=A0AAN7LA29_TRANT|nr:hypothetical protein SAY86_005860 [Trapa natans]
MFEVFVLHLSFQISDPGDYCRRSLTSLHETTLVDPVYEIAQSVQLVQPAVNAQTRLQGRTLDSKLDRLMSNLIKRKSIFSLEHIISTRKRGPFTSVQLISRWRSIVGINVDISAFIHKYPHIFKVVNQSIQRNLCRWIGKNNTLRRRKIRTCCENARVGFSKENEEVVEDICK